jgi:hypothetical protein
MYQANVVEIFIASPSDVVGERDILEEVIQEWNAINSKNKRIILQPVRWEKNVHSDFSGSPQDVINRQILEEADILVAMFWSRIGTPTNEHESGTVEELKVHIEAGKPAIVLFNKADLKQDHDPVQFSLLQEFKAWCSSNGVYFEYRNQDEFRSLARNQLSLKVNSLEIEAHNYDEVDGMAPGKKSQAKMDAIEFVKKIPEFQADSNSLVKFIKELGNYRSDKLEDFFEETELLSFVRMGNGTKTLSVPGRMNGMTGDDLQYFLEDLSSGEYDHCF